jgi:hypothetical protein
MERVAQVAYELNRPLIAGYVNALKQLQQDFNIAGELDINVIARIPARSNRPQRHRRTHDRALEQALDQASTSSKRCASRKAKLSRTSCANACKDRSARARDRSVRRGLADAIVCVCKNELENC